MVFLGITGTLSSGKETLADFFVSKHGFLKRELKPLDYEDTAEDVGRKARECLSELMEDWNRDVVILGFTHPEQVRVFRRRNFFYLLGVDGPMELRYRIHGIKHPDAQLSLESFISLDDQSRYGGGAVLSLLQDCLSLVNAYLLNKGSPDDFLTRLQTLDISIIKKFRPTWDEYFMSLAQEASSRSNCLIRKSGSIIEMDHIVTGTGYTGTPFRVPNCYEENGCLACQRNQEGSSECYCLHSELGAILDLSNRPVQNATLYSTDFPCLQCMKCIVQVKIRRIVYMTDNPEYQRAKDLATLAGVETCSLKQN